MGNFDEREQRPPQPVVIEDKRHGRGDEELEAVEQSPDAEPAAPVEPPALPTAPAQPEMPMAAAAELLPQEPASGDGATGLEGFEPTEEQLNAAQQAEMAYLMQLFQLGQTAYLRSQLGVLLNFAMINLGRMPNPATGIVTADLEQAKISIDTFEFVLVKVQGQLEPRERAELTQLLSDMKYTFMQALGGPAPGNGGA